MVNDSNIKYSHQFKSPSIKIKEEEPGPYDDILGRCGDCGGEFEVNVNRSRIHAFCKDCDDYIKIPQEILDQVQVQEDHLIRSKTIKAASGPKSMDMIDQLIKLAKSPLFVKYVPIAFKFFSENTKEIIELAQKFMELMKNEKN